MCPHKSTYRTGGIRCVFAMGIIMVAFVLAAAQAPTPIPSPAPGSATGSKVSEKAVKDWKPVFDVALGLVGLAGALLAILRSRTEQRAVSSETADADNSIHLLKISNGAQIPRLGSKKPAIKYLKAGFVGFFSLVLSFYLLIILGVAVQDRLDTVRWASLMAEKQKELEAEVLQLQQPSSTDNAVAAYQRTVQLRTAETQLEAVKRFQNEVNAGIYSRAVYMVILLISFLTAAIAFFVYGLLRVRTFIVWLTSHPRKEDSPSKGFQDAEIRTSLCFDYAAARSISAARMVGARIIEFDAETRPCVLRAVKHYKNPKSLFEEIMIEVSESPKGSVIRIAVDGLRPTFRTDAVRNQLILTRLIDGITS
jgi:hypothetical protein